MGLLRNMLLFVVYDPVTRLPKYTKYNFNFEMYAAEKGLINASKFDIFSAFIVESKNTDYSKVFTIDGFEKYFIFDALGNIDPKIIDYINILGSTIHDNYISTKQPDTYILDYTIKDVVKTTQFEIVEYNDSQIRFIQDYGFAIDSAGNMYTKYNFNFELFSSDFQIWGSKLNIFTNFVVRCYILSGAFPQTFGYGLPDKFNKYFISKDNINNYLTSNGISNDLSSYMDSYAVTSNLTTAYKNANNIDFTTYKSIVNPDITFTNLDDFKKYFYSEGQFELATFMFQKEVIKPYEVFTNICTVFSVTGDSFGTGFLFKIAGENDIYVMTCYHVVEGNSNLDIMNISLNDNNHSNIIAACRIIGYNSFADICVGKFDETLDFNIVNHINLSKLQTFNPILLSGENINVDKNAVLLYVGNLSSDSDNAILKGPIIENHYSGSFTKKFIIGAPDSILIDTTTCSGFSGSPTFLEKSPNNFQLVGMYNAQHNVGDTVFAHIIQASYLYTMAINIIGSWNSYSVIYANNKILLSYIVKISTPLTWLGTCMSYFNPIISVKKYKQLVNLNYNGGVLIENFIYGFDLVKKVFVTDTKLIGRFNNINLETPLLNTLIYKRYIESSKSPIVIKSISFYNSITNEYKAVNFGTYGNQESFAVFAHGYKPISQTLLDKTKFPGKNFIFRAYNTFQEIKINYFYYNGAEWVNEDEIIGGQGDAWHTLTTDSM